MAHTSPEFETMVRDALEEWKVPGLSISVISGEDIWAKAYGLAQFPDTEVHPDSIFDGGSTAKCFTAAAVALPVHDDEAFPGVEWETPVKRLLGDDFVMGGGISVTYSNMMYTTASYMVEVLSGQGAGIVFSTATDYAKWIHALMNRTGPLSLTVHEELTKPRTIQNTEKELAPFHSHMLYALGLVVESYRGRKVIGNDGDVYGLHSLIRWMPELKWGIVILGNSEGAFDAAFMLFLWLVDELLAVPRGERVDWEEFQHENNRKAEREEEDEVLQSNLESAVPMSLPIEGYVGVYENAGYHILRVELKDGKLSADCSDRCFGFELSFKHLPGDCFIVESHDILGDSTSKIGAEFRVGEDGYVEQLGVEFVEEMKGELIWFSRLA
ncbi:beta-lactamase/transpeptidase-like protein [Lojkania enalia]|uniref:Beta-lactamase/transpeptidase-like protein n=1 Tax=Lojkania enalia TaxID=147567 RepID=A0A9P4TP20_9PLEO|nr:beta-lactamase/transpeptidase-like protein [Didymosphaeria enalia]